MELTGVVFGKDQGLTLAAAIKSLKAIGIKRVMYWDAGSVDGSLEIVEKSGATVLICPHPMTASEVRNVSAECAETDYLIWISPDDVVSGNILLMPEGLDSYNVTLKEHKYAHVTTFPRIWHKRAKWVGRCHEYLLADTRGESPLTVTHMRGPWHDKPSDPNGIINALLADIADFPDEPRWKYYLGREYYFQKNFGEALKWFTERTKVIGYVPELADAFLYIAHIYKILQNWPAVREFCMMAIIVNPHFAEAARMMASVSADNHKQQWLNMAATATNEGVLFVRGESVSP